MRLWRLKKVTQKSDIKVRQIKQNIALVTHYYNNQLYIAYVAMIDQDQALEIFISEYVNHIIHSLTHTQTQAMDVIPSVKNPKFNFIILKYWNKNAH